MYWGGRNPEIGAGGQEKEKTRRARHGGGTAACYNHDTLSLDWFQAQPKWEISDYDIAELEYGV